MRMVAEWLNPVKVSGMAAYLFATLSCVITLFRTTNKRVWRLAATLGILQAALLLDITFDWRWRLYDWLRKQAVFQNWYERRHWPQVAALAILAVLLFVAEVIARKSFRAPAGATMAVDGSLIAVGSWAMEVISLHVTDSVLYHRVGSLMVISFVWILACLITSIGIFRAGSRCH